MMIRYELEQGSLTPVRFVSLVTTTDYVGACSAHVGQNPKNYHRYIHCCPRGPPLSIFLRALRIFKTGIASRHQKCWKNDKIMTAGLRKK